MVEAAGFPDVIPYALCHSSIVRGIAAGLPIWLVAALHDTSTAMLENRCAPWITESLDEIAAHAIISLVEVEARPADTPSETTANPPAWPADQSLMMTDAI